MSLLIGSSWLWLGQTDSPQIDLLLGPLALTAFLLIVVVWGGRKRWWVFGWMYEEKAKECEEWKHLAQRGTLAAEQGVRVAEKLTDTTAEGIADDLQT